MAKKTHWPVTCAKDLHAVLRDAKKRDVRSIREIGRVADVNQYTAHAVLSGAAVGHGCAAVDNVIKLADALGLEITVSEREL